MENHHARPHRLSDGGAFLLLQQQQQAMAAEDSGKTNNHSQRRRQTISEGVVLKEQPMMNPSSASTATPAAPAPVLHHNSVSSASKKGVSSDTDLMHNTANGNGSSSISGSSGKTSKYQDRLGLGAASSYYFKGPTTPMEKLVRSEQKKKQSQPPFSASIHSNTTVTTPMVDQHGDPTSSNHADLTTNSYNNINNNNKTKMLDSSYLSSSSSSSDASSAQRRNNNTLDSSGSGEDFLNVSVLSDTTELTASNYVALAGTRRPSLFSRRDLDNDGEPKQQQHAAPTTTTTAAAPDPSTRMRPPPPAVQQRRRQTIAPGGILPKPPMASLQRRRRQSMAVPNVFATAVAATTDFPLFQDSIPGNVVPQQRQERTKPSTTSKTISIANQPDNDDDDNNNNTSDRTLSSMHMRDLLLVSGQKTHAHNSNSSSDEDEFSLPFPTMMKLPEPEDSIKVSDPMIVAVHAEPQSQSANATDMEKEEAAETTAPREETAQLLLSLKSPLYPIRPGSLLEAIDARRQHGKTIPTNSTATPSSAAPIQSPAKPSPYDKTVDSPARNTRRAKKLQQEHEEEEEEEPTSAGSVHNNNESSVTKTAVGHDEDMTVSFHDDDDALDALVSSVHSSKSHQSLAPVDSPARNTRNARKKSMSSPSRPNAKHDGGNDTTITGSLGDLWDGMLTTKSPSKRKASVVPHASQDSPARNTRSVSSTRKVRHSSPTTTTNRRVEANTDTTELLGDLFDDLIQSQPLPLSPAQSTENGDHGAMGGDLNLYQPSPKGRVVENDNRREKGEQKLPERSTPKLVDSSLTSSKSNDNSKISVRSALDLSLRSTSKTPESGRRSLNDSIVDHSMESTEDLGNLFDEMVRESQQSTQSSRSAGINHSHSPDSMDQMLDDLEVGSPTSDVSTFAKTQLSHFGSQSDGTLLETQFSPQKSVASSRGVVDSAYSRRSMSRASTIDTPSDMSAKPQWDERGGIGRGNENEMPRAPPSTIRFQVDMQDEAICMDMDQHEKLQGAPTRGLTPSKLDPSPRRVPIPGSRVSMPYMKSLTPSKLAPSPSRVQNPVAHASFRGPMSLRQSLTPSKLAGRPPVFLAGESPSRYMERNKRVADEDARNESAIESSAIKRQRTFDQLQGMMVNATNQSIEITAEIRPDPRKDIPMPPSVLRKKGDVRLRTSSRRVAFGSPEIAEYNIASPSMRLTPMPKKKPVYLPDDTSEIERDMEALHANGESFIMAQEEDEEAAHNRTAGCTPFAIRIAAPAPADEDDDDHSSSSELGPHDRDGFVGDDMDIDQTEMTMALEGNMAELLRLATGRQLSDNSKAIYRRQTMQQPHFEDEPTVSLEPDIATLLNTDEEFRDARTDPTTTQESDLPKNASESVTALESTTKEILENDQAPSERFHFEDEPTIELESDMNALFDAEKTEEVTQFSVASRKRRLSSASRRFSIAPSGRLSLSGDMSLNNEAIAAMETEKPKAIGHSPIGPPTREPFDLKLSEILALSEVQSVLKPDTEDFLLSVTDSLRKLAVAEEVNHLVGSMCSEVQRSTDDEVAETSPLKAWEENFEGALALQRLLRSGENATVIVDLKLLAESIYEKDRLEWKKWIVSSVSVLQEPLQGKCNDVLEEIELLDSLCDGFERQLTDINTSAARKARRRRMEQEMVSRRHKPDESFGFYDVFAHHRFSFSFFVGGNRHTRRRDPSHRGQDRAYVRLLGIRYRGRQKYFGSDSCYVRATESN